MKAAAAQMQGQAGQAINMSAAAVKSCIDAALSTWSSFDKDGDGKLSIAEAVALLNSDEVRQRDWQHCTVYRLSTWSI